jgi:hypothetical protein
MDMLLIPIQVETSNFGVRNPGLMQSHNGDGTCHSDITGQVQNPCPTGVVSFTFTVLIKKGLTSPLQITQMIREGTAGTNDGDGLAQNINGKSHQLMSVSCQRF